MQLLTLQTQFMQLTSTTLEERNTDRAVKQTNQDKVTQSRQKQMQRARASSVAPINLMTDPSVQHLVRHV